MNAQNTKEHSPYHIENKTTCEHPAYLFWKLQSQLTKLNAQLAQLRLQLKD